MIERPARGMDVLGWCDRLWQDLRPLIGLRGDKRFIAVGDGVIRFVPPAARFFVQGLPKPEDTWTGTRTRYLRVPFDGSTPSFIPAATWDAAMEHGMPADAEYYDLDRTFGDQHVPRAG